MRNRILIVFLVLTLVALPFMAACAKPAPPPPAPAPTPAPAPAPAPPPVKPIELKIANFQPALSKSNEVLEMWAKIIEEETGGKVKFTLYPGATLAAPQDTYDATVTGIADVCHTFGGYSPGRFTLSEVINLPALGFEDAVHGARVLWDLYDKFPEIREQYKDVHLLWMGPAANRQLYSMNPAPHVEDIKGMRIRVPGSEAPQVEVLGGIPVPMPGPDVYLAMERGVLDGDFHPWESGITYRWYEIIKYVTKIDYYLAGIFIVAMNPGAWNKLPEDVKEVFNKYSGRYGGVELESYLVWDKYDIGYYDFLKTQDLEFFEWTAEDHAKAAELCYPLWDKWIADMEAKGLPGREIFDECQRLVEKYKHSPWVP